MLGRYPIPAQFEHPFSGLPADLLSLREGRPQKVPVPVSDKGAVREIVKDCEARVADLALDAMGELSVGKWNNDGSTISTAKLL
jgi:hypothetical protein